MTENESLEQSAAIAAEEAMLDELYLERIYVAPNPAVTDKAVDLVIDCD